MCGIAGGAWSFDGPAISLDCIKKMTDAIKHRGPDDSGFWLQSAAESRFHADSNPSPGAILGFRRLAIIDLSTGHQPLGNEDDSIQISFNGEIYNYVELRHRLEGSGHRFKTQTDTETIVHLYEDLGLECFRHLNGFFALAIWDARTDKLILARDRMGKKPLYYTQIGSQFYFASELKCLMTLPGISKTIEPGAVDLYMTYGYIPHPHTIYKNIYKLPPGTLAVWERGELSIQPYWDIDWSRERPVSEQEACTEVRKLLADSVRLRLRSDVPLGAFLSGGIDSSLIVALAQREVSRPIETFSIGFSEADFDETHYAQMVANHVGTNHHRFEVTPNAMEIVNKLAYQYDEPFSDSSAVPTWYLSELTSQHVTVALSGDGGDELFGGYERYRALILSQRLQRRVPFNWLKRSGLLKWLPDSSARQSFFRRVRRFCEALGQPPVERYMNWIQIFNEPQRLEFFRDDFIETLPNYDPTQFTRDSWSVAGKRDLLACASLGDLQSYLPCDLMTKVDIASMAHSLEARQPFLDYRLIEWAASLPSSLKLRGKKGKYLLQSAFHDLLPSEIWSRPKMGFGVPIAKWFRTSLRDIAYDALLSSSSRCHALLRKEAIGTLVDSHMSGKGNHGYRLWNLLMLELWMREWNPDSR